MATGSLNPKLMQALMQAFMQRRPGATPAAATPAPADKARPGLLTSVNRFRPQGPKKGPMGRRPYQPSRRAPGFGDKPSGAAAAAVGGLSRWRDIIAKRSRASR